MRTTTRRLAGAAMILWLAGCGRARPPAGQEPPRALPVAVFADTGRSTTLRVIPPPGGARRDSLASNSGAHAAVWLARVSPTRIEPAAEPSPEAAPDTLASAPLPPPPLVVDGSLKPPLPRSQTPLAVPPGARGSVELDVRVDEQGEVSEVRWAGGARDPALVRAATECARGMRFFPAERAGQPVPVWCRQRFDFGAG
jgi:TonB family protein